MERVKTRYRRENSMSTLGVRKPILGLVPDGIAKTTILESGAGKALNPDDVSGIKQCDSRILRIVDEKTSSRKFRSTMRKILIASD